MAPRQHKHTPTLDNNEVLMPFWDTVKPAAKRLLRVMSTSLGPQTRQSPMSAVRRLAVCTHTTMNRIYGPYKCCLCNQVPNIGWVYVCTQDSCKAPSCAEYMANDLDATVNHPDEGNTAGLPNIGNPYGLSSWIMRDISKGLYTTEQVNILIAQKLHVKETITAHENAFDHKDRPIQPPVTARSGTIDPVVPLPFPVINETLLETHQLKTWSSGRASFIPPCAYKACHRCRPTYRERCHHNLVAVLAGDVFQPQDWQLSYRPISDVNVVRKLGLRKQRPQLRRVNYDHTAIYDTASEDSAIGVNELHRTKEFDMVAEDGNEEEGQTKGFRASVKKAIKGLIPNRRFSQTESESSATSSAGISIDSDIGKRLPILDEGVDEDAEEFDIGL